jgi:hypothetical protein
LCTYGIFKLCNFLFADSPTDANFTANAFQRAYSNVSAVTVTASTLGWLAQT